MSRRCAYNPGPQAQLATLDEGDEVLAGNPGIRLQLPGVTSGSSTLVCAASIHAAAMAHILSWSWLLIERPAGEAGCCDLPGS